MGAKIIEGVGSPKAGIQLHRGLKSRDWKDGPHHVSRPIILYLAFPHQFRGSLGHIAKEGFLKEEA